MKKRLFAMLLSTTFMFNNLAIINAAEDSEDTTTEVTTEEQTEATTKEETTKEVTTEKTTEATTKATTEKQTEATTKATTKATTEKQTEATTSATTTTTKKQSTSNNVSGSFSVTIGEEENESLKNYLPSDIRNIDWSWNSTDSSIGSVSSAGKLIGQDTGSCTITAKGSNNGVNYTYTFNVKIVKSTTKERSITIEVDDTKNLYTYVDDDIAAKDYTWESSNTKYVTVSNRGVITGEKKGSATVTAEYTSGSKKYSYEFDVTVKYDSDDDDDDDNKTSSTNKVTAKRSWTIYVEVDDEVDISDLLEDDPDDYDWDVDDDDIADINDSTGEIEGLEEGDTKIYAEGDEDYTFTVYVGEDYSTKKMSIKGGETKSIKSYLDDDVDEYSIKSDRTSVAKVTSKGEVTGVAKGIATIICKHKDDDDEIIQIFVNVSSNGTTTTTTTEATTEATTKAATTTTAKTAFTDISQRAWAIPAINAMAEKGFIVGVGKNKFSPDANCKRADFAIVLTKILGIDNQVPLSNYADVKMDAYYYKYVGIAKDKGIECGVTDNNYRPEVYITREEIMVMVYKGLVAQGKTFNTDTTILNKYTDANKIAEENKTAVAALINSGAVTGTSDTLLDVSSNITRAQMAVLMNNVYNTVNN